MTSTDPHRIDSVEALRAIVGAPGTATEAKIEPVVGEFARAFIARSPFLLMATADAEGRLDVSPKGDGPGFVAVPDARTLLVPDRTGNRLVFGLQNILANPHVGLVFLVPGTGETLRVNGRAELTRDPAVCERLAARGKPALLAIRVTVEECFFHCAKAFLRSQLWRPEAWPPPEKVSFGRMMARKFGGDDAMATSIDQMIDEDYRNNL
ncbi:MAG: pyridoxamine 5'-phosphate oxidase family protein [bacterium]|nr:pyridoxamine 5'-phosphate oxidase family protein [bacterium]